MKRKYIGWAAIAAIIAILVIILIVVGYHVDTFGFDGSHIVTIATSHSGTSPAIVTRTVVEVPAKSIWDWMQLLIIPLVLAVGGILFNLSSSRTEQANTQKRYDNDQLITEQRYKNDQLIAQQRYENDQEIEADKQREAALQEYLDRMSELLLDKNLSKSKSDDEVRKIAR